jgi:uncharacterized delta-60 repeat protein
VGAGGFPLGGASAIAAAVTVESNNNHILVAGDTGGNFGVARVSSAGSVLGWTTVNFGGNDQVSSIALDAAGRVLLGGGSSSSSSTHFAMARLNSNLSLDSSFGTGGKVYYGFSLNYDFIDALAVQRDGKIIAAGEVRANDSDFLIVRLNSDGSGDGTFGAAHAFNTTNFGYGNDYVSDVAIDDEGKILVAGTAMIAGDNDFALARFEGGQYNYRGSAFGDAQRIQAEDFDNGGQGISYNDANPNINTFGYYRGTGVDMHGVTEDGTYAIVDYGPGEWLEYTVDVPTSGTYHLNVRASSGASGVLRFSSDGSDLGTVPVSFTGGWDSYQTFSRDVTLSAGTHVIRMAMDSGIAVNVNWFQLQGDRTPPALTSSSFLIDDGRTMELHFSKSIVNSLGDDDVAIVDRFGNAYPLQFTVQDNVGGDPSVARVTWNSMLIDGNYTLRLNEYTIQDASGNWNTSPIDAAFFIFAADANHDRTVNLADFNILASNFGRMSGGTFSHGDFNYDGKVNLADFGLLAARMGHTLNPPSAASSLFSSQPIASAAAGELRDQLDLLLT